ncbi:MAG: hypothetical protein ACE5I1_23465 [bacterium]
MVQQLFQFRSELYQALTKRTDAALDLVDALASIPSARSVIDLSQSEPFRRGFSSVYDAIENFNKTSSIEKAAVERLEFQKELLHLGVSYLPEPIDRKFFLFGVDCVSIPCLYVSTLEDRSFVHQPTVIRGNKPIELVRIKFTDEEGKAVYKKPDYLVICGKRQAELTLQNIYSAFKARFNLKHCFRFGKQRLLLASAQTPAKPPKQGRL